MGRSRTRERRDVIGKNVTCCVHRKSESQVRLTFLLVMLMDRAQ